MPRGVSTKDLPEGQAFKVKSDLEILKESVYNILTTNKGERAGNPAFGSDLNKLLFNPNLEPYWEAIKLEVIRSVEIWEPRVALLSVEFLADEDNNKLTLIIFFISLLTGETDGLVVGDLGA